ncbi:MAG TPA: zf-HC2 domain-containing protein [Anaerolineales bacterium]|nr:zf-HC2 domain-containing protein [Anaerolineales bacterium]
MSNEEQKIDCNVICDLMVVYASGEASEETIAFIEAHITECPECQEAYEAAQRGEALLAELEPAPRPIQFDGRKILIRVQRIFFGAITFVLFLAVLGVALTERWIVQGLLRLPLPRLYAFSGGGEWIAIGAVLLLLFGALVYWRSRSTTDRSSLALTGAALLFVIGLIAYKFMLDWNLPGVIVAGTLLFALYGFLLYWRTQQKSERFWGEFLLSLEAAVPLLILTLATLTLVSSGNFAEAAFSTGLLILAIFFTMVQISRLPYMVVLTPLILLTGGIMLLANAVGGVASLFDLTPQWPAELGHPDELDTDFDLTGLGFAALESFTPTGVGSFPLPEGVAAREEVYLRPGGGTASVIVIQFTDRGSAHDFLSDWQRSFFHDFYSIRLDFAGTRFNDPNGYGDHPLHWRLELPGVWFGQEGQIVRSYDDSALAAYNAWQVDEWVTIVEVEGGVAQAIPLSRQIKELVSESYQR